MIKIIVKLITFFLIFFCLQNGLFAQQKEKTTKKSKFMTGAEIQWYPAGWIIGPAVNYAISPKHNINARIAVNLTNRRDWSGLNDDEKGKGFGGSVGYRFLFTPNKNSFFLGARVDVWGMKIDWKDNIGTPIELRGSTNITILQPAAEVGYWLRFKNQNWNLLFSAGGGAEINVKTKGKEVGQGGVWLLGVSGYYAL